MGKLQEVVRALRHAGAVVEPQLRAARPVDAANHTPRSLRNLLSIMYSKEDLILRQWEPSSDGWNSIATCRGKT